MAAVSSPNNFNGLISQSTTDLNTLPDPRTPSPMPAGKRSPPAAQHPDLSNEVAALSTKLINAINHQTNLDDELQESRHELEAARERIQVLEAANREHASALDCGILVRRSDSVRAEDNLKTKLAEEQLRRSSAEKDKKGMELELESLTTALFEEANEMVASARHETEASGKRADQIQAKLDEAEVLLASHQEQLRDLKNVLQQNELERTSSASQQESNVPTTPTTTSADINSNSQFKNVPQLQNVPIPQLQPPQSPLHFTNLIHPVVRTDLQAYDEFMALLRTTRNGLQSRTTSGSYTGLNILSLGSKDNLSQSTIVQSQQGATNSSSRSQSASNTPNLQFGSAFGTPAEQAPSSGSLKDTKFYKRALVEDIEPALRLDTAPGLSWLARRNVLSSMASGSFIVEPFNPNPHFPSTAYPCSLCNEERGSAEYLRRHRFKTSENAEAQRYPVCQYCLDRVRATCDFMNFLRLARSGVWKNETIDECKIAWEECVRLREKMFWSRVGGGVVPTIASMTGSPITPTFASSPRQLRRTDTSTTSTTSSDDLHNSRPSISSEPVGPISHRPSESISNHKRPRSFQEKSSGLLRHALHNEGSLEIKDLDALNPKPDASKFRTGSIEPVKLDKPIEIQSSLTTTKDPSKSILSQNTYVPPSPSTILPPSTPTSTLIAPSTPTSATSIRPRSNLVASMAAKFQDANNSPTGRPTSSGSDTIRRSPDRSNTLELSPYTSSSRPGTSGSAASPSPIRDRSRSPVKIPGSFT